MKVRIREEYLVEKEAFLNVEIKPGSIGPYTIRVISLGSSVWTDYVVIEDLVYATQYINSFIDYNGTHSVFNFEDYYYRWNGSEFSLEEKPEIPFFTQPDSSSGGVGSSTFMGLTDVPNTYSGSAGYFLRVNNSANGLEFVKSPVSLNKVKFNIPVKGTTLLELPSEPTFLDFCELTLNGLECEYGSDYNIELIDSLWYVRWASTKVTLEPKDKIWYKYYL